MRRPSRCLPLTLLALLLSAGPVGALELDLPRAIALGLEKNLGLKAEAESVPQAAAGRDAADAAFDPTLRLSAQTKGEKTPIASPFVGADALLEKTVELETGLEKRFATGLNADLSLGSTRTTSNDSFAGLDPEYRSRLVLTLTQPLLRDFGTEVNRAGIRQAELLRQQARLGYRRNAQQLAATIETACLNLLQAEEERAYRQQALELARQLLDGNRRKLALGQVPKTEVQQAETALAAREELLLLARQQVDLAREQLLDLLELPPGTELRLNPADEKDTGLDADRALVLAHEHRPELRQAALALDSTGIDLQLADNRLRPRLDARLSAGINGLSGTASNGGTSSYTGTWSDSLSSGADRDGYQWQAGLVLRYPLGNRSARAEKASAESRRRQQRYRLERLERRIATETRQAWLALQTSRKRLEVAARTAELARQTLEQENRRLEAGLSDSFRLLILQDDLIEARIRQAQARGDAARNQTALLLATGTNLIERGIELRLPEEEL